MASIPGYCPHCGVIFDGQGGIHVSGSSGIQISNVKMTCPNCGKTASLLDGTFSEHGRGLELVSGPPLTRAVLARIQDVARRAQAGEITPEMAVAEAKAIDPVLGRIVERFLGLGLPALAVLVALISLYLQWGGSQSTEKFQKEALDLLARQTRAIEAQRLEERERNHSIESKRDRPSAPKANPKAPTIKKKSTRRRDVNKARRELLKARRKAFPARNHRPS